MNHRIVRIHPKDNVLVALQDLAAGELYSIEGVEGILQAPVSAKHKFSMEDLHQGDLIYMYGGIVGKAVVDIPSGHPLTTSNVTHEAESFGGKTEDYHWEAPDVSKFQNRTFQGFHRSDGQVGTGNYWLVIPLVFCENRNVDTIKEAFWKN
ncbi:UxaA family hydrolase [Algoriphagus halophilus]|uniref:UxaA family hydrolase n=1 Tax=Algoriphagus halophilus TaxID=226505 RepID=UPI00358DE943